MLGIKKSSFLNKCLYLLGSINFEADDGQCRHPIRPSIGHRPEAIESDMLLVSILIGVSGFASCTAYLVVLYTSNCSINGPILYRAFLLHAKFNALLICKPSASLKRHHYQSAELLMEYCGQIDLHVVHLLCLK